VEARRGDLPGIVRTGATFADAAAEYMRWLEHDQMRKPSTLRERPAPAARRGGRSRYVLSSLARKRSPAGARLDRCCQWRLWLVEHDAHAHRCWGRRSLHHYEGPWASFLRGQERVVLDADEARGGDFATGGLTGDGG
jgi:hypothetical protein